MEIKSYQQALKKEEKEGEQSPDPSKSRSNLIHKHLDRGDKGKMSRTEGGRCAETLVRTSCCPVIPEGAKLLKSTIF